LDFTTTLRLHTAQIKQSILTGHSSNLVCRVVNLETSHQTDTSTMPNSKSNENIFKVVATRLHNTQIENYTYRILAFIVTAYGGQRRINNPHTKTLFDDI
jgi:hypothetical protein